MPKTPETVTNNPANITAEQIENLDVVLGALAWQNYLKRLLMGQSESEARTLLMEQLSEYINSGQIHRSRSTLLDNDPQQSFAELKQYLRGELSARESHFVNSVLPELMSLSVTSWPNLSEDTAVFTEARREYYVSFDNLLRQLDAVKFSGTPEQLPLEITDFYQRIKAIDITMKNQLELERRPKHKVALYDQGRQQLEAVSHDMDEWFKKS